MADLSLKENLEHFNESEFEKVLNAIEKMSSGKAVQAIGLSKTTVYTNEKNEYIIKTDKVYQDFYIKLSVEYA